MEYLDSLEYLNSFINYEREREVDYPEAFRLERMTRLAKELGNPQNAYESILIAGSKGKGHGKKENNFPPDPDGGIKMI